LLVAELVWGCPPEHEAHKQPEDAGQTNAAAGTGTGAAGNLLSAHYVNNGVGGSGARRAAGVVARACKSGVGDAEGRPNRRVGPGRYAYLGPATIVVQQGIIVIPKYEIWFGDHVFYRTLQIKVCALFVVMLTAMGDDGARRRHSQRHQLRLCATILRDLAFVDTLVPLLDIFDSQSPKTGVSAVPCHESLIRCVG